MKWMRIAMAVALLALLAATAQAGPIAPGTYTFLNHPDGNLTSNSCCGPYGLRLDFLEPPSGAGPTFSVEGNGAGVTLVWGGGSTALISGVLFNNSDGSLWNITYTLTGITEVSNGFWASGAAGTLSSQSDPSITFDLTGKANSSGHVFDFLMDGHRLDGDGESIVGRGWVDEGGTNDWLVRAEFTSSTGDPVTTPEPGSLLLLAGGLGFLGWMRRRR